MGGASALIVAVGNVIGYSQLGKVAVAEQRRLAVAQQHQLAIQYEYERQSKLEAEQADLITHNTDPKAS